MDCEGFREAISARADGEAVEVSDRAIARHLGRCRPCAAFAGAVEHLRLASGAPSIAAARTDDTDLRVRIVAMARGIDQNGVWWGLRVALLAIAIGELVLAVPDLFGHAASVVSDVHTARHLGAFQAAYAAGLIVVAFRPAKARAFVPLTAVLVTAMLGAAIADVVQGITPAVGESGHSLEISGLLLVWLLATRRGWPGRADPDTRDNATVHPITSAPRSKSVEPEPRRRIDRTATDGRR